MALACLAVAGRGLAAGLGSPPRSPVAPLASAGATAERGYRPGGATPPLPPREFRGVWVATVNNIDWPSRSGLPVAQQKAEALALLERAVALRLNAVIFQVRPACDALYASRFEPWSEYLTGEMGRAPQPGYDPLAFLVAEAHRRGLELHAWFNPFRARHSSGRSLICGRHVSRVHPQWVRSYGEQLWLDPGERATHDYSLGVILDVVRRYDVDGVHIDDYFYPYPDKDGSGRTLDFPDETTWRRYVQSGGKLGRNDWRRDNVNAFVRRLYQEIKAQNPRVKVGVSPFGIWRPSFPLSIRGFDAYERLYADSRLWLARGWLDYCAPQLYWSIDAAGQSYPVLLNWWAEQNELHRHLWPGNDVYRAGRTPGELAAQIQLTRRAGGATGNLLWSMHALQQNPGGVTQELTRQAYAQPALVPASPWLDGQPPGRPLLSAERTGGGWKLAWKAGGSKAEARERLAGTLAPPRKAEKNPSAHDSVPHDSVGWQSGSEAVWLWVFQCKGAGGWLTEIIPGSQTSRRLPRNAVPPEVVSVRAVDRCGNLSLPALLQRSEE